MKFSIGNICKEVQRIQFDLEQYGEITSAIDRCKNLDQLLCDIEDGTHELENVEIIQNDKNDYKIIIKNTRNADSRTATEDITIEDLKNATIEHINDVNRGMQYFASKIREAGNKHDYTKLDCFEEVYAPSVLSDHRNEDFKQGQWYQRHITEERHHLNSNAHADVNLIDVLEMIADCVMAGNGRAGHISSYYCDVSPELLYRAYWNTIRMLDDIVVVSDK